VSDVFVGCVHQFFVRRQFVFQHLHSPLFLEKSVRDFRRFQVDFLGEKWVKREGGVDFLEDVVFVLRRNDFQSESQSTFFNG